MNKRFAFAAGVVPLVAQAIAAALLVSAPLAWAGSTPADPRAIVYIGWPNDGQVLPAGKPFRVWFGLRYMGVAPAGVKFPNTGHHHLLVDTDLPSMDEKIPSDRNHLHFGAGQTETMLDLPPGKHTLQLLMGDFDHTPHNPPVYSKKITIFVK